MKHKWVLQDKNTGHFAKEDGNYSFRIDDANLYPTRASARNDCLTSETVKKVLVEVRLVFEKPKKKKVRRWKSKELGLFNDGTGTYWLEAINDKAVEFVYTNGKRVPATFVDVSYCEKRVYDSRDWVEF